MNHINNEEKSGIRIHSEPLYIVCVQQYNRERGIINGFADLSQSKIVLEELNKPTPVGIKIKMESIIRTYYKMEYKPINGLDGLKDPTKVILNYIGFCGRPSLWTKSGAIFELSYKNNDGIFKFEGAGRER